LNGAGGGDVGAGTDAAAVTTSRRAGTGAGAARRMAAALLDGAGAERAGTAPVRRTAGAGARAAAPPRRAGRVRASIDEKNKEQRGWASAREGGCGERGKTFRLSPSPLLSVSLFFLYIRTPLSLSLSLSLPAAVVQPATAGGSHRPRRDDQGRHGHAYVEGPSAPLARVAPAAGG